MPKVPPSRPQARKRRKSTPARSETASTKQLSLNPVKSKEASIDYRRGQIPQWVDDLIRKYVALDGEGEHPPGFMARALVQATMPYKDPRMDVYVRRNGDFSLRIVAGYEGGIPFGVYPRLLLSWIVTEAVRTQSPRIELGSSLSAFLRDVMELNTRSGGPRGAATRVAEQMKRLFGSLITAQYSSQERGGFSLRNVMLAESLDLEPRFAERLRKAAQALPPAKKEEDKANLWVPQDEAEAGQWDSQVVLTQRFFQECVNGPVPINLAAYKDLRGSPLAMDIYAWATYRVSYLTKRSRPIPWEALMLQFGSGFTTRFAVHDFRKAFLQALKAVQIVYPHLNVEVTDTGLVLLPSQPHIPKLAKPKGPIQGNLI